MICYQTDSNGYFVGTIEALPNPAAQRRGATGREGYLLPKGATWEPPPDLPEGMRARWDGAAWELEPLPEPEPEPEPETPEPLPELENWQPFLLELYSPDNEAILDRIYSTKAVRALAWLENLLSQARLAPPDPEILTLNWNSVAAGIEPSLDDAERAIVVAWFAKSELPYSLNPDGSLYATTTDHQTTGE